MSARVPGANVAQVAMQVITSLYWACEFATVQFAMTVLQYEVQSRVAMPVPVDVPVAVLVPVEVVMVAPVVALVDDVVLVAPPAPPVFSVSSQPTVVQRTSTPKAPARSFVFMNKVSQS